MVNLADLFRSLIKILDGGLAAPYDNTNNSRIMCRGAVED